MAPTFKIIFASIITLFSIEASAQKTFEEDNYTITYPDNWTIDNSGAYGTNLIVKAPAEKGDSFRENINLIIQDLSSLDLDMDTYIDLSEQQLSTMMEKGKIIESKRIGSGSAEYHKIIYSGSVNHNKLKFEALIWIKDKKAYVLTLACESKAFNDYKKVGEEILNSFQIN